MHGGKRARPPRGEDPVYGRLNPTNCQSIFHFMDCRQSESVSGHSSPTLLVTQVSTLQTLAYALSSSMPMGNVLRVSSTVRLVGYRDNTVYSPNRSPTWVSRR